MTLLCNSYVTWGTSFDEMLVSLDCCITGLWHPINMNYVFKTECLGAPVAHWVKQWPADLAVLVRGPLGAESFQ